MLRCTLLPLALLIAIGCSRPAPPTAPTVILVENGHESMSVSDDGSIPPPRPVVRSFPEESLSRGVAFLLKQQSSDGSWRSDVYGTFKDGTALTPLAVTALQEAHDAGLSSTEIETAIKKGVGWLVKFVKRDGTIDPGPDGFDYPIYTAALSVKALSHPTAHQFLVARDAWVKYILDRQLTEKLGWKSEEKQYGGWGYCRVIPKKPEPNMLAPNLIESNLSATVFALDALKAAGVTDAEVYLRAEKFLLRCQIGDGGFHFIYDDPTRNKAGGTAYGSPEPTIFFSYGSATADGVHGLFITEPIREKIEGYRRRGNPTPWVMGFQWLEKNFRADMHPGQYVKAHEPNREAVYYYYAASVSRAFRECKLTLPDGRDWAAELSAELAKRQREDGSWLNPVELVRENDQIVATCNAVTALARCKK
jgi:prenyltransferase beta subunit